MVIINSIQTAVHSVNVVNYSLIHAFTTFEVMNKSAHLTQSHRPSEVSL